MFLPKKCALLIAKMYDKSGLNFVFKHILYHHIKSYYIFQRNTNIWYDLVQYFPFSRVKM